MKNTTNQLHHVVIVGGGAGGLELATKLGDSLGRQGKAIITLIDQSKTHVWKPLLHEIAAGSMNPEKHELVYLAQAHWHHFNFRLGSMDGLNRAKREISIAPNFDEDGVEVIPRRTFQYDTLIMAVGSTTNDFGIKGASEYSIALDTQEQAERFHRRLHNALLRAQTQTSPVQAGQLEVVIVGAGATGVELSAELHNTTRELAAYGLDKIDADRDINISLIEASERVLPALPARLSDSVELELKKLNVHLYTCLLYTSKGFIGVVDHSPATIPMDANGLIANARPYRIQRDLNLPSSFMIDDLAKGDIDIAIAWGPIGGYFAKQSKVPMVVVPIPEYETTNAKGKEYWNISVGVRKKDKDRMKMIDAALERNQVAITKILDDYGIPHVPVVEGDSLMKSFQKYGANSKGADDKIIQK